MGKILVICLLLLLTFETGYAENSNTSDRYQWIVSTDQIGFFFDKGTIKFGKESNGNIDFNVIDVWLKEVYTEESKNSYNSVRREEDRFSNLSYSLRHHQFDLNNFWVYDSDEIDCDENGIILKKIPSPGGARGMFVIRPGTIMEKCIIDINIYVTEHRDQIIKNSK